MSPSLVCSEAGLFKCDWSISKLYASVDESLDEFIAQSTGRMWDPVGSGGTLEGLSPSPAPLSLSFTALKR